MDRCVSKPADSVPSELVAILLTSHGKLRKSQNANTLEFGHLQLPDVAYRVTGRVSCFQGGGPFLADGHCQSESPSMPNSWAAFLPT
jgi:hypothetical protein